MVLFVFVVMMLNLGGSEIEQERQWLKPGSGLARQFCRGAAGGYRLRHPGR
jgi:NADH:ubiquinone oxidoreductase subunit 6 (subunit J)